MATSGTYAFDLAADELLTEAWERCGLNPELITQVQARSALRSLSQAMQKWTNAGLNLWQVDRVVTATVIGTATLATPAGTTDVLEMYVTASGTDLGLSPMSRQDWMALPTKSESGRPTQYWVERVNRLPVIHLWPVPDAVYPLVYSRIRLPQDMTTLQQTADVPAQWLDALSAELAARLAMKFAPDRAEKLEQQAVVAFALAAQENRERVPATIIPMIA